MTEMTKIPAAAPVRMGPGWITAAYHADTAAKAATVAYWLEHNAVSTQHHRQEVLRSLRALADMMGYDITPRATETTEQEIGL